jgi:hypothetical protein
MKKNPSQIPGIKIWLGKNKFFKIFRQNSKSGIPKVHIIEGFLVNGQEFYKKGALIFPLSLSPQLRNTLIRIEQGGYEAIEEEDAKELVLQEFED